MRTQRTKKTKTSKRWLILMLTGILLIATVTIIVCLALRPSLSEESTPAETTSTSSTSSTVTTASTNTSDPTNKTPVQNEPTDGDTTTLSGSFTGVEPVGDILSVRVLINQQVPSSSTCTLNITSASGKSFAYPAPVINNPSTASCEGYDIPLANFPSGELLTISLDLTINSETTTLTKTTITL